MKFLIIVLVAACGGGQKPEPVTSNDPPGVVTDSRTTLEKRRDAGCEKLRPRLVQCAIEDAKAELDAGRITQKQFEQDTATGVREKLGDEWMKACQVEMSSRQVRVLEVCDHEESQCGPLTSCLAHLNANAE